MKKLDTFLAILSAAALFACGCSSDGKTPGNANTEPDVTEPEITEPDYGFDVEDMTGLPTTFRMESSGGTFSHAEGSSEYTITSGGEYDCYGELYGGRIVVNASENSIVTINLNGCTVTNDALSPVALLAADRVDISAKSGTVNKIYDLRTTAFEDDGTAYPAAVYAECDLNVKGTGELNVVSNYNNGVHTKKDLNIKNLTLTVKAVNAAIRGNDSVTVSSGAVTAISSGGDAVKTSATSYNKKGAQRGTVNISGGSVKLYAACDGIDGASNVNIYGGEISVLTDEYSEYSGDVMNSSKTVLYLRMGENVYGSHYKYSAYFYSADGSHKWVDMSFYQKVASVGPGGPGRPGGRPGSTAYYYYYSAERPAGYTGVMFYAYTSDQAQGQSENYAAVAANDTTIPASFDTYVISSVSTSKKVMNTSGWTAFKSASGSTGLEYSCKGIKAGNLIKISGGETSIKSKDDGLHADFDDVLESTGKKGEGSIAISGGKLDITTSDDGLHADQDLNISGGEVTVADSYEGAEANRVIVEGGTVTLNARDDGINANSKGAYTALVEISGGYVDVAVPGGDTDTIDSNGNIMLTGGTLFIKNGQTAGINMTGGTLDSDGSVTISGGTLISIGCISKRPTGVTYDAGKTLAAGEYSVKDGDTELFGFKLTSQYKAYMFWSEAFSSGKTYTVYKDGASLFTFTK